MSFSDFSPVTDLDNLVNTLEEYGVAVLPSVFSDEECDQFRSALFNHLRDEHKIVEPDDICNVSPIQGGAMFTYGLSLTKPVLDVKTSDKALAPFRRFFPNDSEFTTSLDGMFIGPPPEQMSQAAIVKSGGGFFDPSGSFFHTDQASEKPGFCCAQSYITFEATEHGDGCLTVFIRSNKYHQEFFKHFGLATNGENFYQINKTEHQDWYLNEKGCEWKMISAPRGSMVFWDSRTIHYFAPPRLGRPNPDRWRLQVYVCYTPARLQNEKDAETKRNAYINNQCTDHWPYNVKKLFDKDENDHRINSLSNLTERHRKYLGF